MIKTTVETFSKYDFFLDYLYLICVYIQIYIYMYIIYMYIYLSIYLSICLSAYLYKTYNWLIVYKQDITDSCLT